MEGPSLYLAQEQLRPFNGKEILAVSGNTAQVEKEMFLHKKVKNIFSWGKHLVFQFDDVAVRIHFMLFGTFSAEVEGKSVTGDYKKTRVPRLKFEFKNGMIEMYNCSIKLLPESNAKKTYNFTVDIMSPEWDDALAYKNAKTQGTEEIADFLLDQDYFAGVGNIIKNEVLSLTYTNPRQQVKDLSPKKLKEIIKVTHEFSHQFYAWRKEFLLLKNLKIHRKGTCPHCGGKVTHEKTGKRNRIAHYCQVCQPLK